MTEQLALVFGPSPGAAHVFMPDPEGLDHRTVGGVLVVVVDAVPGAGVGDLIWAAHDEAMPGVGAAALEVQTDEGIWTHRLSYPGRQRPMDPARPAEAAFRSWDAVDWDEASFILGTAIVRWTREHRDVPMLLSVNAVDDIRRPISSRSLPVARVPVCIDSAGYTEIQHHGRHRRGAERYVAAVRRVARGMRTLRWASVQDWTCDPGSLERTGLTVEEHQRRTVASLLELRSLAPEIPWVPVLQGSTPEDYERHAAMHAEAGVELDGELVGVGSLKGRPQDEVIEILRRCHRVSWRIHAFGLTGNDLAAARSWIESSDSCSWAYDGRRRIIRARASFAVGQDRDADGHLWTRSWLLASEWARRQWAEAAPRITDGALFGCVEHPSRSP